MEQQIPNNLMNHWNKDVLNFIEGYSAHGDIAEALLKSVEPLGDVQSFCPDTSQFRYLTVSTKGIIFGIALGMHNIAFRLNPPFNARAIITGGNVISELGKEWIEFTLGRDDWPEVDLIFWARKAYVYARELKTHNITIKWD